MAEKYLLPREFIQITLIEKRDGHARCAFATHAGIYEIKLKEGDYDKLAKDRFFVDGGSEVYHVTTLTRSE